MEVIWNKRPDGGTIDLELLKRRSWTGVSVYFVKIAAPVTYDFKLKSTATYVALRDFYRTDGVTRVGDLPPSSTKDMRNKMAFVPSGCEVEGWHSLEKPANILVVIIESVSSSRHTVDLSKLPPRIEFEDPLLRSLMLRFQALLDDPALDTPGYVETLTELLTFELARTSPNPRLAPTSQSGLSPKQIKVVTEYIDSHLFERMSISELAALVDLTRFHFIRAFKQAAGVSPLQFMIRRRVDRAKELLTENHDSIAEIAERTGFGSAVQMTRAFRRVVGATPSAFRRNEC